MANDKTNETNNNQIKKPDKQTQPAQPKKHSRIKKFFREIKQEFKATTWPSRSTLISTTSVVLVILFVMGGYFGLLDYAFSTLTKFLITFLGIGG